MNKIISLETLVKNVAEYKGKRFMYVSKIKPSRFPFESGFVFSFKDILFDISPHTGEPILNIQMEFKETKNNKSKAVPEFYSSETDSYSLTIFDRKVKQNNTLYTGNTFNCIFTLNLLASQFAKEPIFQLLNA